MTGKYDVIGFYPMCADILHAGHISALEWAKSRCDHLIVGLNVAPDGKDPVQSVWERFSQLRACRFVDEVIAYAGRKDLELLALTLRYDCRFLGKEYELRDWDGKEQESIRGILPIFIPRLHNLSSTELKERIISK